jgi:hypothetical protein
LARAEDGGARGDAILAVLVLEAIEVVAIVNVLEKIRALRRHHRAVVLVVGPDERRHDDVARGEGHGGPHPDGKKSGRLLDDVGGTNANEDDNDDTPPPPPKTTATPRGGRGAGKTTVPDDDVTAAAASRDAVATNATNAIGPRGARDLHAGAETETW